MQNTDLKKFIYNTGRRLSVADVKKIITGISKAGKIVKDRTDEHTIEQFYEGPFPLPQFPESADLKFLSFGSVHIELSKGLIKSDPELACARKLFEQFRSARVCCFGLREKRDMFGEAGLEAAVQVLDNQLVVSLTQPAPGSALEFTQMLANGNWPVTAREADKGLNVAHITGGMAEYKEYSDLNSVVIEFTCPGWSVQKVFSHLGQMIKSCRYKLNYGDWELVPTDGEIKNWKQSSQMIKGIIRSGVLASKVNLNQIEWRLANYQGFAAMAVMHKKFSNDEEDGDISTRLFEFELEGQRGFMELACEAGGFCAFFSFDTKEPFSVLSKITGQKLKEWS